MFLSSIVRSLFNDDFSNAILFYVFGLADICIFLVSAKQPSKHRQKIMDRKKIRKRKRKRPSYLNDFLDESTADNFPDHENEQIQNVQKESLVSTKNVEFVVKAEENKCCLCDESLSKAFDVNHSTGSSELTFKEVLNSMFISLSDSSSSEIPRLQFGSGFICVFCKVPIQDLDLLQHKVMGLKRVILGRAKNKIEDLKSKSKVKEEAKREEIKEPPSHSKSFINNQKNSKNRRRAKISRPIDSDSESQEEGNDGQRPKRDKPANLMSDIERAKIKNLPADLKFEVKKRSKTDPYIIEYLKEKKGSMYLVKWENRHEKENSWESRSKIPPDVLQYYEEDLRRLGTQAPVKAFEKEKAETQKPQTPPRKHDKAVSNMKKHKSNESTEYNSGKEESIVANAIQRSPDIKVVSIVQKKRASDDNLLDYLNLSKTGEQIESNDLDNCGEYIEPHCDDLLDETIGESTPEENDGESNDVDTIELPVRKSKRDPKPKTFNDDFLISPKSKIIEKEIQDSIESDTIRKSKREPKPKKMDIVDSVSKTRATNTKVKQSKKKENTCSEESKTYIVEALVDKKGDKYLVKWKDYPSSENTWEPKSAIPESITKFYEEDKSRLGMPVKLSKKKDIAEESNKTYIIEALVDKKGDKYLVKWENYPSSKNTWEPKSSIPKFIIKFYDQDKSRLGMPAPDVS